MESWASPPATRAVMQANRSKNTVPELALRRELHRMGLRYRIDARPIPALPRRADIVFRGSKVAVFVDGRFWHRCPEHGTLPKSNVAFWETKLTRNVERDRESDEALILAGWLVVRVWEHDISAQAAQ
jgi:DNA mismatch endonuclease (patch repair protein)